MYGVIKVEVAELLERFIEEGFLTIGDVTDEGGENDGQ